MWGCVLTPTEGSVPLWLAALHLPLCHLPQEKGQTEKFIYVGREAMPPGVMVYTKAPLEGSAPRGLLKGCYRAQQVPAGTSQWVCAYPCTARCSSGVSINLASTLNPLETGSVHVRVPPLPEVPLLVNHSHEQGIYGLDRGRSSLRPSLGRSGAWEWVLGSS